MRILRVPAGTKQRPSLSQGWAFDFQPRLFPGPRGRRPCCNFIVAMSIAVSAVIVPSRLLRCAQALFGAANLGAAVTLGRAAPVAAAACLLAGAALLLLGARVPKVRRIDISGLGQLRLTVQQGIGASAARVELAELLRGSTVWPGLMLLRLRRADGRVGALALLPDSVESGQFRCLSVAIRNIAARKI